MKPGGVAVGEAVEKHHQQDYDDEVRAPGDDHALEEELGQLGALVEEKKQQRDDPTGYSSEGCLPVAAIRLCGLGHGELWQTARAVPRVGSG